MPANPPSNGEILGADRIRAGLAIAEATEPEHGFTVYNDAGGGDWYGEGVVIVDPAGNHYQGRDLADAMRKLPEAELLTMMDAHEATLEAEDLPTMPRPPMRRGDFLKPAKYTPKNKTLNRRRKLAAMAKDSK